MSRVSKTKHIQIITLGVNKYSGNQNQVGLDYFKTLLEWTRVNANLCPFK